MADELGTTPAVGGQPQTADVTSAAATQTAAPVTQPVAVETQPAPVVAPAQTAQEAQPTPEEFRVPGIEPFNELEWQRKLAQQALETAQKERQLREELELQQIPEEERDAYRVQRELEGLRQEREQWQMQQVVVAWRDYVSQYDVKDPEIAKAYPPLQQIQDPGIMIRRTFETQAAMIKRLQAENATLRQQTQTLSGVQSQPAAGPPVTTTGTGAAPQRSLHSLTPQELDDLAHRARMGLLKPGDIPGL